MEQTHFKDNKMSEEDHPNRRMSICDALDDNNSNCHLSEIVSERAADKAVKKVFAILGVDINKPESVEEFREDLRFGKKLRKLADHGVLVVVALICTGLAWAAFDGIISRFKR